MSERNESGSKFTPLEKNVEWTEARELVKPETPGDYEVEDLGPAWVLCRNGWREALIFWGSQDAVEAHQWLSSVAFARCSRDDCGIRLGEGQKAGDVCRHHRREMNDE